MAVSPDPVIQYYNVIGSYPANNQQWWLARAAADDATRNLKVGDFMPELLQKTYNGNMHAPRGHYTLNAFYKDRSTISGIPGLTVESIDERPSTISFFSGRVWYACNSTVYFSQVLVAKKQAGLCYMDADPTSENISDPVDTDGGVIPIPESSKIIRIIPHGGSMLVFAKNGVWAITGTASGFTALDISVNKVSPIGCHSAQSVIETDSAVFWWSDVGIMAVSQSSGQTVTAPGQFSRMNISEATIQSFYNEISETVRQEAKGVFDPKGNCIYWLYRDTDVAATQYNRVLILDLTLNAFYPWKFSRTTGSPYVKGIFVGTRNATYTTPTDIEPSQVEYTCVDATPKVRISQVRSGAFTDWPSVNGQTYESFMEAGYELFNDAMRKKNITYLFTYFTQTETTAIGDTPDYPSACDVTIKWDWANSNISNQWSQPTDIYRRLNLGRAETGYAMVINKLKIRGNGKAIQFRFGTSEAGKNFDLNGWSIAVTGNIDP